MTANIWRYLIAAVLLAHGIGHSLGLFPAFGLVKTAGWSEQSWLLTPLFGDILARWLGALLWLGATMGFIGAGAGLLVLQGWWRPLALASAVVSLVGLALFWSAFPGLLNKVGAIAIDIAVLVGLLWAHWPTTEVAGA